ncbi:MAG: hypothetical protein ABH806_00145 [Candidatus Omnitrophota bacterium]
MRSDKYLKSFVFLSGSGCLLPAFIIFNLLFGWIFLSPVHWMITEGVLILFFVIKGLIVTRRVVSSVSRRDDAIDVEAKVLDEKDKPGSG